MIDRSEVETVQDDLLKLRIPLSNFEGRLDVSVEEFLHIAGMTLSENGFRAGSSVREGNK